MALDIVMYPDKILRAKSAPVTEITDDIKKLVRDMARCLLNNGGAGLSAPQVGKSLRIIIINLTGRDDDCSCLINPEIVSKSEDRMELPERCLSLPGIRDKILRPRIVRVTGKTVDGDDFDKEFDGWASRVIQHEVDHLDGILFIDHIKPMKRKMIEGKLKKLRRNKRHSNISK